MVNHSVEAEGSDLRAQVKERSVSCAVTLQHL